MVRTMSVTLVTIAILPIALILLIFGIELVNPKRSKGFWMKIAVVVNSALVMALGLIGCKDDERVKIDNNGGNGKSDEKPLVACYVVDPPDVTETPDAFDKSDDWMNLENAMAELERQIDKGIYDEATEKNTKITIGESVLNLKNKGLLTEDEAKLIEAYCYHRVEKFNFNMVVSCYAAMPSPGTKEGSKLEIVEATTELRELYRDGKISTPAYETALSTLDKELAFYTGKSNNTVLRQLLLDLADGTAGSM